MTNPRRRMAGLVTRARSAKTVSVRIDRSFRHPLYQKVMRKSRDFLVHDEIGCHPGDWVQIVESRPLSRRKRWTVERVLRQASAAEVAAGAAEIEPAEPESTEAEPAG